MLYTGEMYQLVPYINLMVNYIEMIEASPLARLVKAGRAVNKVFNISVFSRILGKGKVEQYDKILRNIALLLQKAGVDFGYLYEDELYCGALIYRSGLDDVLAKHARKVKRMLKEQGVRNLITVDPHTTDLFRTIYPSLIGKLDISIKSYMEVMVERELRPQRAADMEVVIHDSCCYARYAKVIQEPQILLERAQFKIRMPKDFGIYTMCCGGPIEALYPKKALRIAEKRMEQLKEAGENVAVMCPICLANLSRVSRGEIKLDDLANYLAMAYL